MARVSVVVEPAAHYIQDPEGQVMCDECDAAVQTEETGKYNTQLGMELNFAYEIMHTLQAVSYTHLTLPTNREV